MARCAIFWGGGGSEFGGILGGYKILEVLGGGGGHMKTATAVFWGDCGNVRYFIESEILL